MPDRIFDPQCLRLVTLVRERNLPRAADSLEKCIARQGPEWTYLHVLAPAVFAIGELFTSSQISADDCDFGVTAVLSLMNTAKSSLPRNPPLNLRCFATLMPGITHSVGFISICHWLERDGWQMTIPDPVPPEPALIDAIVQLNPDLLALSCSLPRNVVQARRIIRTLRDRGFASRIYVGGLPINVVPGLFQKSGADATAKDIVSLTRKLAQEFHYTTQTPPHLPTPTAA